MVKEHHEHVYKGGITSGMDFIQRIQDEIFQRWSTWAFDPRPLEKEEVELLLRAAQWAPSSGNNQPWKFIVVESPETRQSLHEALGRGNLAWVPNAPLVIVVAADPEDDHIRNENEYYAFDCGLAVQNLLIQATHMGLATHPIGGWDADIVKQALGIPEHVRVVTLIVVGHYGDPAKLDDRTREKMAQRRERKRLVDIAYQDRWGEPFQPQASSDDQVEHHANATIEPQKKGVDR